MTVRELIRRLSGFNRDAAVIFPDGLPLVDLEAFEDRAGNDYVVVTDIELPKDSHDTIRTPSAER